MFETTSDLGFLLVGFGLYGLELPDEIITVAKLAADGTLTGSVAGFIITDLISDSVVSTRSGGDRVFIAGKLMVGYGQLFLLKAYNSAS